MKILFLNQGCSGWQSHMEQGFPQAKNEGEVGRLRILATIEFLATGLSTHLGYDTMDVLREMLLESIRNRVHFIEDYIAILQPP